MDKNNVQITDEGSLFTQAAMNTPAYEQQVDELMARIMADVNQAAQDRSAGKKAGLWYYLRAGQERAGCERRAAF